MAPSDFSTITSWLCTDAEGWNKSVSLPLQSQILRQWMQTRIESVQFATDKDLALWYGLAGCNSSYTLVCLAACHWVPKQLRLKDTSGDHWVSLPCSKQAQLEQVDQDLILSFSCLWGFLLSLLVTKPEYLCTHLSLESILPSHAENVGDLCLPPAFRKRQPLDLLWSKNHRLWGKPGWAHMLCPDALHGCMSFICACSLCRITLNIARAMQSKQEHRSEAAKSTPLTAYFLSFFPSLNFLCVTERLIQAEAKEYFMAYLLGIPTQKITAMFKDESVQHNCFLGKVWNCGINILKSYWSKQNNSKYIGWVWVHFTF